MIWINNLIFTVAFSFILTAYIPLQAREDDKDKVDHLEKEQSHVKSKRDKDKSDKGHIKDQINFLKSEILRLETLIGQISNNQVEWSDILNRPPGLDDGDDMLNQMDIENFGFVTGTHTNIPAVFWSDILQVPTDIADGDDVENCFGEMRSAIDAELTAVLPAGPLTPLSRVASDRNSDDEVVSCAIIPEVNGVSKGFLYVGNQTLKILWQDEVQPGFPLGQNCSSLKSIFNGTLSGVIVHLAITDKHSIPSSALRELNCADYLIKSVKTKRLVQ